MKIIVCSDHLETQKSGEKSNNLEAKTPTTIEMKSVSCESKTLTLEPNINPPTIIMSSVTPPSISPVAGSSLPLPLNSNSGSSSPLGSPNVSTPTHPLLSTRRDSTTQVIFLLLFSFSTFYQCFQFDFLHEIVSINE